ncbi:MAG TPA: hypothetical protein VM639_24535 [Dongiaceae bacterium]|nr:hypothetical protein [Dongiaceae bacterium]
MDSSFGRQLGPAIAAMMFWAIVGIILAAVAIIGGAGWAIWYLWHHLMWVQS